MTTSMGDTSVIFEQAAADLDRAALKDAKALLAELAAAPISG
jgi:hypothetical protein